VAHFGNIYKEEDRGNITNVVKITCYFTSFFDEATNMRWMEEI
jgi:hypothetical protein